MVTLYYTSPNKVRKSREEKREVQETRDFLAGMQQKNRTSDDTSANSNGNGNGNARYCSVQCDKNMFTHNIMSNLLVTLRVAWSHCVTTIVTWSPGTTRKATATTMMT